MTNLILFYHPFSSYCQKVVMALQEKQLAFRPHLVDLGDERQRAELETLWPYAKFPVLHDMGSGMTLPEASLIVEYIDGLNPDRPPLIPPVAEHARNVRLWDRIMDNYLHAPLQKIVGDRLRPEDKRDPHGVEEARALLQTTYRLLEQRVPAGQWLGGPEVSLADCAAAPALYYAARVAPFLGYPNLRSYFDRLVNRFSFKRCIEDARQYRHLFPSAPDDAPWTEPSTEEARASF